MTDETKFPAEVLEQFRRSRRKATLTFTAAPERFFEAWKQACWPVLSAMAGVSVSEADRLRLASPIADICAGHPPSC